jgi:hypothetical protein
MELHCSTNLSGLTCLLEAEKTQNFKQAVHLCTGHGLSPRARLKLAEDGLDMCFDCLGCDSYRPCNAFIGHAPCDHSKNARFAA